MRFSNLSAPSRCGRFILAVEFPGCGVPNHFRGGCCTDAVQSACLNSRCFDVRPSEGKFAALLAGELEAGDVVHRHLCAAEALDLVGVLPGEVLEGVVAARAGE